ncbi:MAG: ATP-dependent Clp protease proteolytic subunit [Bifidobacterium sp.]|nr:ATP-dependent Clp protease proteolytic subunit [Bifidobacterium sp.]
MASEEAKFVQRAERLAGPAGFRAAAAAMPQSRYVVPEFEEKTPYGYKRQNPYTRLFDDRIIFMGVQVDDTTADDIMAQLLVLESLDPNRDVMMYINSPGGSMTAMTAIYDTMNYIQPDVQTVCLGQAASAAAILLAAGTKGKRLILPNARVLIHQPAIDQGFGKATEIEIQAKEMLRMRTWLEDTLAERTGQSVERVRKDIEVDTFLTAQEAKEYGIVDEVLQPRKKEQAQIAS